MVPDLPSLPSPAEPSPAREAGLDRRAVLAALRARVAREDATGREAPPVIPLNDAVDAALPGGGLPRASLHEIFGDPGAAAGFAALLLARSGGTVLWIARGPDARTPGLARYGLPPSRLILAQPRDATDALWIAEEALRCPAISGALLPWESPDAATLRRLQLAAETGGGIGLLLRGAEEDAGPSPAATRWRVTGRAGGAPHDLGDPQWTLDLLRCRSGRAQRWHVTWRAGEEVLVPDEEAAADEAPGRARRR